MAALPGVEAAVPLGTVPGEVRTVDDGAETWEAAALRVVPADTAALDPDVVSGSLADIDAPDTVAVSSDTAFTSGAGLGETLTIRLGDDVVDATVVAVYSRGMGVGGIITGPATAEAHGLPVMADTVLVDVAAGTDLADATAAITALGATAADPETYITTAMQARRQQQRRRDRAAPAAARGRGGRCGEHAGHDHGGASRRARAAAPHRHHPPPAHGHDHRRGGDHGGDGVGASARWRCVPAVVGVSAGVLDGLPVVDLPSYLIVSAAVVVFALAATALAARRTTRLATAVA